MIKWSSGQLNYSHSGYAWAFTRHAYDNIQYFYDKSIIGSGDYYFVLFLINGNPLSNDYTKEYIKDVEEYRKNLLNFRITYLPTLIRHFYLGSKNNRCYDTRHKILTSTKFNPNNDLIYNKDGVLEYSKECPEKLKKDLYEYFTMRREDQ